MPKAQAQTILWLLMQGELKFDYRSQLEEFWPNNFSAICETMFAIYQSHDRVNEEVEVFYLSKGLADSLRKWSNDIYKVRFSVFSVDT